MHIPVYKITAFSAGEEAADQQFYDHLIGMSCELLNISYRAPLQLVLHGVEGLVRLITDRVIDHCVHDDMIELETELLPDIRLKYDGYIERKLPAWQSCDDMPRIVISADGIVGIPPRIFCKPEDDDFTDEEEDDFNV